MTHVRNPLPATERPAVAVLEHLSGPSIGLETPLHDPRLDIRLDSDRLLDVRASPRRPATRPVGDVIARLIAVDGTYRLETGNGAPVWINGRKIEQAELINNDIVEFGEKGPLSRFRLIDPKAHPRRYFSEICDDCWDYLTSSRKPLAERLATAIGATLRRLVRETTVMFRVAVLLTVVLLGFMITQQYRINQFQETQLAASREQIESFARTLAETRQQALTPDDLAQLKSALSQDISAGLARLAELERKSVAAQTSIAAAAPRIAFIQGAYGYRDAASGRVMRHVLDTRGQPIVAANGVPLLSLDGDGPPAERTFTGTGFAVADGSVLATNRHVAQPWKSDGTGAAATANGVEPFLIKLVAYAPGVREPWNVELLNASEQVDLALLRLVEDANRLQPLPIASAPAVHGGSVIVLGYPTGLRSMLVRTGKAFIQQLEKSGDTGFWEIAERLAHDGLINPLASFGIVAQLTPEYLVYDAATTSGGSGGPVLNLQGEVVAVNTAVLSGYTGSNFGVPVEKLRRFMAESGLDPGVAQTGG